MTHSVIAHLLSANAKWAESVIAEDPDFFIRSARDPQAPEFLWIGCSDSRVPETLITGSKPGDIFVNRNIGNQVRFDDDNMLAVLTYAVEHLDVKHVIICGHTECGAVKAAFDSVASESPVPVRGHPADSPLNRWLFPLTALAAELQAPSVPVLVQENVKAQLNKLIHTEVIRDAWQKKKEVWVHGLVYDLATGRLRDLGISQGRE
ncbi:carbonic anhydrase [Rhodocollybia butyracea]|uniref:Carbonic anhydrase n=1 Tax=Rhodocollybia butyracea TaxID=206335 RepID=A0A9P5U4E1_9AGAR|nr:carbonic anhydrase [Rhodocollybia butyracea]